MLKRCGIVVTIMILSVLGLGISITSVLAKENTVVTEKLSLPKIPFKLEIKDAPIRFDGKERKVVYLTIDDGITVQTRDYLDLFKKYGVKATFFLIGTSLKGNEEIIRRMQREGHYIGMHSITHDYKILYNEVQLIKEMKNEQALLNRILGYSPILFRCPYGSISGVTKSLRDEAVHAHLKMWDWTIDSNDWRYQDNPKEIIREIKSQLGRKKEVILIHDRAGTLSVLPSIITLLKQQGYIFEAYKESNHFPVNFWHDSRL